MMTMLSVVRDVMDSNGWPALTVGVAGSQDQNMRQSFALINKVLFSTSFKKNWPILTREYQFDTVPGQGEYDLPADFHHWIVGSAWNAGQYYQMKGSLPAGEWYRCMYAGYGDQWFDSFRIDRFDKKFVVCPTPSSVENLVFMYVTNLIVKDAAGNYKTRYDLDTDISLVDEEIIELGLAWRWRQKKGMDYTAELAEYNGAMRERFAQYLAAGEINVGGCPVDYPPLTNGYIGPGPIGV